MDKKRCVGLRQHQSAAAQDTRYARNARRIEQEVQRWVARYGTAGLRGGIIRIPVVVHVIYNTSEQNIPRKHIDSQIDVLNADFRRLNADAAGTPAAFAGVAADARLEFALAVRDPDGRATSGITRTKTKVTGWAVSEHGMKACATGGRDPWDVDRYLNIWVVNYADNSLGYGTRPPEAPKIQGVTCHYQAFGTVGGKKLEEHARLGRTATHEIGHWLDLIHIWGNDEGDSCTDSDNVDDTPNQKFPTPFDMRPKYPRITCNNRPDGDMFMNFMDASGDECKNMFTVGQVTRMHAALHTQRSGLLDSQGLAPPYKASRGLWISQAGNYSGARRGQVTQRTYCSDDIWVRGSNDGRLNQDHENPRYNRSATRKNYVYVRVRNGAAPGNGSRAAGSKGTVKLYWAIGSTGLAWPSPWDGAATGSGAMGGLIGSKAVRVRAGESEIVEFQWSPPDPSDAAGAGCENFSLLARIETSKRKPYGMTSPETVDLAANVLKNSTIAWKNVAVVNEHSGEPELCASAVVANFRPASEAATLRLEVKGHERPTILDWGDVFVELPADLAAAKGNRATGIKPVRGRLQMTAPQARLGTFTLARGAAHLLRILFVPHPERARDVRVFELDLVQETKGRVVGGRRFVIRTEPDRRTITLDTPPNIFDGVSWVPNPAAGSSRRCEC